MFVARWMVDVRFGHKDEAVRLLRKWSAEVAPKAGFAPGRFRLVTGSIGALESRVESEVTVASLAELEKAWSVLPTLPEHAQFGRDLEPHIVSGTNRWEIFRVLDA